MLAYRIEWNESEEDWGVRPDGYSLHKTLDDARAYLIRAFTELSPEVPAEYSYPSNGWREPAVAQPIEVPEESVVHRRLCEEPDFRVFSAHGDTPCAMEYREVRNFVTMGSPVVVSYGERGYSPTERALMEVRDEIAGALEGKKTSPVRAIEESRAMARYLGVKL